MTESEKNELQDIAEDVFMQIKAKPCPEWKNIPVKWSRLCGVRTGILGAYLALTDSIILMRSTNIAQIVPAYIHELVHAVQRGRYGLAGYFLIKIFARQRLENEAGKAEAEAEKILTGV